MLGLLRPSAHAHPLDQPPLRQDFPFPPLKTPISNKPYTNSLLASSKSLVAQTTNLLDLTPEGIKYDEQNKEIADTVYAVGTVIARYVDPRSNDRLGFPAGACTEYIARQKPHLFKNPDNTRRLKGNAEDRLLNAQRLGIETGKEPRVWAIAVYQEGNGARRYGHVAYVEKIQTDGTLVISEMNYREPYVVTHRVVRPTQAAGYIYE